MPAVPELLMRVLIQEIKDGKVKVLVTTVEGKKIESWLQVGQDIRHTWSNFTLLGDEVDNVVAAQIALNRFKLPPKSEVKITPPLPMPQPSAIRRLLRGLIRR